MEMQWKYNKYIKEIDFSEIDFLNPGKNIMLNLDILLSENVINNFSEYSYDLNSNLYKSAMRNIGNPISEKEIEEHIRFLKKFK